MQSKCLGKDMCDVFLFIATNMLFSYRISEIDEWNFPILVAIGLISHGFYRII